MQLTSIADIDAAHELIKGSGCPPVRTPLLPVVDPSEADRTEQPLWIKPECFQLSGAFKIRGALHALSRLDHATRKRGVVAYSSGNHARAVAHAARAFGVPATVVVPHTAPAAKVAAARALGAEIVPVELADREARAAELVAERGATLLPPFDHPDIIAGQGTVGREIVDDLPDVDVVLVPISGGGLISGVATAVRALRPATCVIGVQPELSAPARDSFRAGELRPWPVEQRTRTAADGLTGQPSELTLAHILARVHDVVTVPESALADAVGYLARSCRVVAEFSGAASVAAYRHHGERLPAGRTVAVVSGGNIDPATLSRVL